MGADSGTICFGIVKYDIQMAANFWSDRKWFRDWHLGCQSTDWGDEEMKRVDANAKNGASRHHEMMNTNRFAALKSTYQVSASVSMRESQHIFVVCPCILQVSRLARTTPHDHLRLIFRGRTFHQSTATTISGHLSAQIYHLACNILYISSGDSHC